MAGQSLAARRKYRIPVLGTRICHGGLPVVVADRPTVDTRDHSIRAGFRVGQPPGGLPDLEELGKA